MRCPKCDNTNMDKLKVWNDGFSIPSYECMECGEKWTGQTTAISSADLFKGKP